MKVSPRGGNDPFGGYKERLPELHSLVCPWIYHLECVVDDVPSSRCLGQMPQCSCRLLRITIVVGRPNGITLISRFEIKLLLSLGMGCIYIRSQVGSIKYVFDVTFTHTGHPYLCQYGFPRTILGTEFLAWGFFAYVVSCDRLLIVLLIPIGVVL